MKHRFLVTTAAVLITICVMGFTACDQPTNNGDDSYTVMFKLGYAPGNAPTPIMVGKDKVANNFPENPVRPGWGFTGWYDEYGEKYDKDTQINGDVTLTADWYFDYTGLSNPIIRNTHTCDPATLVDGDTVYLYVGHDLLPLEHASNEYFRIPEWLCYSTKDMKHWTAHGPVLKSDDFSYGLPNSAWAAQVVKGKDGKYYYYVTIDSSTYGQSVAVAVSDNPTGPFEDARATAGLTGPLIPANLTPNTIGGDIDPTVWVEEDGTPYLIWGNRVCYQVKLDKNMIERASDKEGTPQEITAQLGTTGPNTFEEAPWLYKRGEKYYLVFATMPSSRAGETIDYAMADSPLGPWTHMGQLMGRSTHYSYTIHPAVIDFKGLTYFIYHDIPLTIEELTPNTGRRAVCIDYMYYTPDGRIRPIIQTKEGVSVPPLDY
jgi:uncharacterized repeat protein (TIGR02543 family)